MLALSNSCRYFLYQKPADMRFGIYSLAGLVRNELGFNPLSGDVFVFIGKRANQIRLLQWDRDGFSLYIKKLGDGATITSHQLSLVLQGVMLKSVRLRKRYTLLKRA